MTGMEHEADGSWLVPLLLLAALCWQVWVSLRATKPTDRDAKTDNKPATAAWPLSFDFTSLSGDRKPAAPVPQSGAPPRNAPFADAVHAIRIHHRDFDLEQFVDGAESAYETIVTAFAAGDTAALRSLVTSEVYDAYAGAIAARDAGQAPAKTVLVRLAKPQLVDVAVRNGTAEIRIRFLGTWLSVRPAGGDAATTTNAACDTVDEWTFTQPLAARDPNWRLSASN